MRASKTNYHHGDLRRELILAGVEVVGQGGPAALTLREVARRVGVSHTAVYHHFRDKADLFAVVAEEGYRELARRMRSAGTRAGVDPIEQIHAFARAYVRFAADRPVHFRVMSEPEMHRGVPDRGGLREAHDGALEGLVASVVEAQATARLAAGDPREIAVGFWTLAHGYAESHRTGRGIFADRPRARLSARLLDQSLTPLIFRMLRGAESPED